MKFDYCIGNPPYHIGVGKRKIPVYNRFIMLLTGWGRISDVVCLITPDGFVKGGKYLESCREHIIENKHLKYVEFRQDNLFNDVSVKAAITVFDNRVCFDEVREKIVTSTQDIQYKVLDWVYRDVIVDDIKYSVLKIFEDKCKSKNNMSKIISAFSPCADNFFNSNCFKRGVNVFKQQSDDISDIRCLVNEGTQDFYFIDKLIIEYQNELGVTLRSNITIPNYYKVCFPKAGYVRNKGLKTFILDKRDICTDKFLCIFVSTMEEALNAQKYFNSKFYRAGLDSKATSWNIYRDWHSNIPIQDFTNNSDIDWSKSSHEIDLQLYHKYNFTQAEIDLVERYING